METVNVLSTEGLMSLSRWLDEPFHAPGFVERQLVAQGINGDDKAEGGVRLTSCQG
jgi:hypothetical protein